MSGGWTAKRFWSEVQVVPVEGGFAIHLDNRPVKTPAKAPLVVPTQAMAQAIAEEWAAQEGVIKPETMPVTRSANAAIDKVATQRAEVVALIAEYGGSDLLCYRAEAPAALAARQAAAWDPLLDWAVEALGAPLCSTAGIVPVPQDPAALARLHARVAQMSAFEIAALHDLVGITGSLILGLAVALGRETAARAWDLSRIDEDWQISQWGDDDEAIAFAEMRREALLHAERFWQLAKFAG